MSKTESDPFAKFKRDKFLEDKPLKHPKTLWASYQKRGQEGTKSPVKMSFGTFANFGGNRTMFNSVFNFRFNLAENLFFKVLTEDFKRFVLNFKYKQVVSYSVWDFVWEYS